MHIILSYCLNVVREITPQLRREKMLKYIKFHKSIQHPTGCLDDGTHAFGKSSPGASLHLRFRNKSYFWSISLTGVGCVTV